VRRLAQRIDENRRHAAVGERDHVRGQHTSDGDDRALRHAGERVRVVTLEMAQDASSEIRDVVSALLNVASASAPNFLSEPPKDASHGFLRHRRPSPAARPATHPRAHSVEHHRVGAKDVGDCGAHLRLETTGRVLQIAARAEKRRLDAHPLAPGIAAIDSAREAATLENVATSASVPSRAGSDRHAREIMRDS